MTSTHTDSDNDTAPPSPKRQNAIPTRLLGARSAKVKAKTMITETIDNLFKSPKTNVSKTLEVDEDESMRDEDMEDMDGENEDEEHRRIQHILHIKKETEENQLISTQRKGKSLQAVNEVGVSFYLLIFLLTIHSLSRFFKRKPKEKRLRVLISRDLILMYVFNYYL